MDKILSYAGEKGMILTMRALTDAVKRIPEFLVRDSVKLPWGRSAALFEEGREPDAIKEGLEAHTALQNIFSAYLRNAAIPKKDGDKEQAARFQVEIARRDAEYYYDEDIIAGLRKTFGILEAAVHAETDGVFDQRIEAYLAMKKALSESDSAQARHDKKRLANAANFMAANGVEPTRVQMRIAKIVAAQKAEDERRRVAETAKIQRKTVANEARAMFA
jgi:hypothetical protein